MDVTISYAATRPPRRRSFWALLRWNLHALLRWWHAGATLLLFGLIGWRAAGQMAGVAQTDGLAGANVWDALLLAFGGPARADISLIPMLTWFVPYLLFFYLIGDAAYGELVQRGCAVVPAMGSRQRWWWSKVATLALLACGYTVLGIAAALLGALTTLPWAWEWRGVVLPYLADVATPPLSAGALLGWVVGLFGSTLVALALWQTVLAVLLRRSVYGLIAVVLGALCSWLLGIAAPGLVRWLPGAQSMLLWHTPFDPGVPGFSLGWSLVYNTLLTLGALSLGAWHMARMDIFGQPLNERG